jgi:hypothetical protein
MSPWTALTTRRAARRPDPTSGRPALQSKRASVPRSLRDHAHRSNGSRDERHAATPPRRHRRQGPRASRIEQHELGLKLEHLATPPRLGLHHVAGLVALEHTEQVAHPLSPEGARVRGPLSLCAQALRAVSRQREGQGRAHDPVSGAFVSCGAVVSGSRAGSPTSRIGARSRLTPSGASSPMYLPRSDLGCCDCRRIRSTATRC